MRLRLCAGRRAGVLAAAVVAGVACLGAVGGGGPAGAATLPGGTWGQPQAIPGLAALTGAKSPSAGTAVSCASLGNCTAVGSYQPAAGTSGLPFAVTETDGTWGSVQSLAGVPGAPTPISGLKKVSCGAPGYCAASGSYSVSGDQHGYLATEVKGAWSVRTLPGTIGSDTVTASYINGVACTSSGDCTAVGTYATTSTPSASGQAFTLDESGGTWGTPQPVAGLPPGGGTSGQTLSGMDSVSCSGPGDCTAGGAYNAGSGYVPFVVSESGGTWGSAQEVPGFAALNPTLTGGDLGFVLSVSCPGASDCAVAGLYEHAAAGGSVYYAVFTADETGGTWGSAKALDVPAQTSWAFSATVGCRSAGNCVVTGSMDMAVPSGTSTQVFAATETSGGSWGQGQVLPGIPAGDRSSFGGLSCVPGGDCTVAGVYVVSGTSQDEVFASVIAADGTLGAVQPVQSTANAVTGLDCPQDGYCTLLENDNNVAQLVTEANPASVTLTASPAQVSYDSEPAETFTATVSSTAGGTPTGTVTVTGPSGAACTITLSGGTGKCSSSSAAFPVGTDTATGTYNGDLHYVAASATANVTVTKAKTAIRLTPSATVITPGRGTTDTLTVTVGHAGTVAPTGTVQVKDGSYNVCTVTLSGGTGHCAVNADQLITHGLVLTAAYPGDANFLASTSPPVYLTVAPAAPVSRWQGQVPPLW